jgi:hypothetical protein
MILRACAPPPGAWGGTPAGPKRTVEVAPREKNSEAPREKTAKKLGHCELCGAEFTRKPRTKRFCTERCRRRAERRRYRERHTEEALCRNCESVFERTATSKRKQVYCSPACLSQHRSASYAKRPDIQAGIRRARESK